MAMPYCSAHYSVVLCDITGSDNYINDNTTERSFTYRQFFCLPINQMVY